jgi:phosphoribosylformylglycinamidine cyclo-ligase
MEQNSAYARAGVDLDAGKTATGLIKAAVEATYTPQVLAGLGSFGGLFSAAAFKEMTHPILVASTDGVGTKTRVAARLNQWEMIGHDLVNHCINDILVQGAEPLFFLDYIASSNLDPERVALIVKGVSDACRAAGCAILGGETAEMPGVYAEGEIDVVGTIIGVVDQPHLIDGSEIEPGDVILGLASSGIHTNGYSLARSALADENWLEPHAALDRSPIGQLLLTPHKLYLPHIKLLLNNGVVVRGLAHITGGGIIENLPRILPAGKAATIERGSWPEQPLFHLIQALGEISSAEMFRVFNMGLGMLVIVPSNHVHLAQRALGDDIFVVGSISTGEQKVTIEGLDEKSFIKGNYSTG